MYVCQQEAVTMLCTARTAVFFFFCALVDDSLVGSPFVCLALSFSSAPQNWDQESADSEEDAIGGANDMSDDDSD